MNKLKNTGAVCLLTVQDSSREDGQKHVDLGNYYKDRYGQRFLITSRRLAEQYGHLVDVPVYVMKADHR